MNRREVLKTLALLTPAESLVKFRDAASAAAPLPENFARVHEDGEQIEWLPFRVGDRTYWRKIYM